MSRSGDPDVCVDCHGLGSIPPWNLTWWQWITCSQPDCEKCGGTGKLPQIDRVMPVSTSPPPPPWTTSGSYPTSSTTRSSSESHSSHSDNSLLYGAIGYGLGASSHHSEPTVSHDNSSSYDSSPSTDFSSSDSSSSDFCGGGDF